MHCWKSVNVELKYNFYKTFMLSCMMMLAVFVITYVPFQISTAKPMDDRYSFVLLVALFLMYPLHKVLHVVPIANHYKKIKIGVAVHFHILPTFSLKVQDPVRKSQFALSLAFPFLTVSPLLLSGIMLFPQFGHYFLILLAYHSGLCVKDLIYLKSLYASPKNALVEESDSGFELLIAK